MAAGFLSRYLNGPLPYSFILCQQHSWPDSWHQLMTTDSSGCEHLIGRKEGNVLFNNTIHFIYGYMRHTYQTYSKGPLSERKEGNVLFNDALNRI